MTFRLPVGTLFGATMELLSLQRHPRHYAKTMVAVVLSKAGRQRGASRAVQERLQKYISFSSAFSDYFRVQNGFQRFLKRGKKGDLKSHYSLMLFSIDFAPF